MILNIVRQTETKEYRTDTYLLKKKFQNPKESFKAVVEDFFSTENGKAILNKYPESKKNELISFVPSDFFSQRGFILITYDIPALILD
ncbi:MAG: hypothetical protein ACRC5C_07120 [Bacilli bacterium]